MMSNKNEISNWSSVGYLKCVQFYNWFRLHQTHYVSTVTEQTEQYTKGKQNWKQLDNQLQ